MPKGSKVADAEQSLKSSAAKRGLFGRSADNMVYGTLNKIGLMHGNKPTKRGLMKASRGK